MATTKIFPTRSHPEKWSRAGEWAVAPSPKMFQAVTENSTGVARTGNTRDCGSGSDTLPDDGLRVSENEWNKMSGLESGMSREKGGVQENDR